MKKINLAITGCMGRMGQQLIKSSKKDKYFKLLTLTENNTDYCFSKEPSISKTMKSSTWLNNLFRGLIGLISLVFFAYLFSRNRKAINWNLVSSNPKAISLLETKLLDEKIWKASRTRLGLLDTTSFRFVHWDKLSSNPNAIALLETKALEEKQLSSMKRDYQIANQVIGSLYSITNQYKEKELFDKIEQQYKELQ